MSASCTVTPRFDAAVGGSDRYFRMISHRARCACRFNSPGSPGEFAGEPNPWFAFPSIGVTLVSTCTAMLRAEEET